MALIILNSLKHSFKKHPNQIHVRLVSSINVRDSFDSNKQKDNLFVKKFNELNQWYIKLTGLDEIKRLQDKVIIIQDRLEKAQEERREIGRLLVDVRKRSVEIQEQLHQVKRWENVQRFLDLTKQETEMIREEKDLTAKFEVLDQAERELFTTLSNTVRDSHEKEKAQAEYTKYWGIILSIFGTIVGAVVSTIISTIRNRQIVNGINNGVEDKFIQITNMIHKNTSVNNIDDLITQFSKQNGDLSKLILDKLNSNDKQINESYTVSQEILKQLHDTNNIINTLKFDDKQRYLLTVDSIQNGDKFLDVGNFVEAQRNLLLEHQKQIQIMGFILACIGIATLIVAGR